MKTRYSQWGVAVLCFISYFAVILFGCSSTQRVAENRVVPQSIIPNKNKNQFSQPANESQNYPAEEMLFPGAKDWLNQLHQQLNVHAWLINVFCMEKQELGIRSKNRKIRTGRMALSIPEPRSPNS